jgi:uncharacterized integral membrane protein
MATHQTFLRGCIVMILGVVLGFVFGNSESVTVDGDFGDRQQFNWGLGSLVFLRVAVVGATLGMFGAVKRMLRTVCLTRIDPAAR